MVSISASTDLFFSSIVYLAFVPVSRPEVDTILSFISERFHYFRKTRWAVFLYMK